MALLLGLALLPAFARADEHLDAALAVVTPPSAGELEQLVDLLSSDAPGARQHLRERLEQIYQSDEFRTRAAAVYMHHLSADELTYLAHTFQHPVFRKYRRLAPEIFVELAAVEREMFARATASDQTLIRIDTPPEASRR